MAPLPPCSPARRREAAPVPPEPPAPPFVRPLVVTPPLPAFATMELNDESVPADPAVDADVPLPPPPPPPPHMRMRSCVAPAGVVYVALEPEVSTWRVGAAVGVPCPVIHV